MLPERLDPQWKGGEMERMDEENYREQVKKNFRKRVRIRMRSVDGVSKF